MRSQTLEQVAGKRKKLLADMGTQMAAEVRKGLAAGAADEAARLVHAGLAETLMAPHTGGFMNILGVKEGTRLDQFTSR